MRNNCSPIIETRRFTTLLNGSIVGGPLSQSCTVLRCLPGYQLPPQLAVGTSWLSAHCERTAFKVLDPSTKMLLVRYPKIHGAFKMAVRSAKPVGDVRNSRSAVSSKAKASFVRQQPSLGQQRSQSISVIIRRWNRVERSLLATMRSSRLLKSMLEARHRQ
jgi:hypothetical protein